MAAIATAMLAASIGQNLISGISQNTKAKNRKKNRRNFFNENISPLLGEATEEQNVDYGSLFDAEMQMPLMNAQNQMESIARSTDVSKGASGFQNSGFIERDKGLAMDNVNANLDASKFQTQRGLIDMQSQLDSILNENKIRAKELEYSYKYG